MLPSVWGICCCLTLNTREVSCEPFSFESVPICLLEKRESRPYGMLSDRYATTAPAMKTRRRRDGRYIFMEQYFLK